MAYEHVEGCPRRGERGESPPSNVSDSFFWGTACRCIQLRLERLEARMVELEEQVTQGKQTPL